MSYCIPDNYVIRQAVQDFEGEAKMEDSWQNEVYLIARRLADEHHYQNVIDIGCGSGFKLLKHLGHLNTIGIDLPPAVEQLQIKYSDRKWVNTQFAGFLDFSKFQLVICSDVIEHVDDPDALCDFIKHIKPRHMVISTPDRALLTHLQPELGPPRNTCHVREWSFVEFGEYMRSHFTVDEHFYSNKSQFTQCVVARLK